MVGTTSEASEAQIGTDVLAVAAGLQVGNEVCGASFWQEPPEEWDTSGPLVPKQGLLQALGIDRRGADPGGPVRCKKQTISRCQDGKSGVGTNLRCRGHRLHIAQQDRHWAFYGILGCDGEKGRTSTPSSGVVWNRAGTRGKGANAGSPQGRRRARAEWCTAQRHRPGGRINQVGAEGPGRRRLRRVLAEPDGALQTIETRLADGGRHEFAIESRWPKFTLLDIALQVGLAFAARDTRGVGALGTHLPYCAWGLAACALVGFVGVGLAVICNPDGSPSM